jgi:hypothetical protein
MGISKSPDWIFSIVFMVYPFPLTWAISSRCSTSHRKAG